jgi:protease-4
MDILKTKISFGPNANKILKILFIVVVFITFVVFWAGVIIFFTGDDEENIAGNVINNEEQGEQENCNVFGIMLHGDLMTYISPADYNTEGNLIYDETSSDDVTYYIEQAEKDEKIKAIILEIDSYGGMPVAGEEIAEALKEAEKPMLALIRGAGLSSAYYAATGADTIFASQNSDVGSIGVTLSYLDNVQKNQREGFTFNQLSSGKYKDLMNPDKPLTDEERGLLMRDVKIMNEDFIKAVAENRKLDINKVRKLADGSSMLGKMALENGLIDKIGGYPEVKQYLKELIGEEIEICW